MGIFHLKRGPGSGLDVPHYGGHKLKLLVRIAVQCGYCVVTGGEILNSNCDIVNPQANSSCRTTKYFEFKTQFQHKRTWDYRENGRKFDCVTFKEGAFIKPEATLRQLRETVENN
jgi:hypothetical protein